MADPKPTSPSLPPASYFNVLQIRHMGREFFFDFGQITGRAAAGEHQFAEAHLVASLVTSPSHAKAMLRALQTNLDRYEEIYGEIQELAISTAGGEAH